MVIHTSNISQSCSIMMMMKRTETSKSKNVNRQINEKRETRHFTEFTSTYHMIKAIQKDDIDEVRSMIKIGVNVNCDSKNYMDGSRTYILGGKTALTFALSTNLDIAKLLIDNGVNIDRSHYGTNPSIIDIVPCPKLNVRNKMNALKLLVDHDADLTVTSRCIFIGHGHAFFDIVDMFAWGRGYSTEFDAYVHKLRTRKKWNCSNHSLYPIKTRLSICTFLIIMNGDIFSQNLNWDVMDKIMKYVAYGANNHI